VKKGRAATGLRDSKMQAKAAEKEERNELNKQIKEM
jgi:hypothetical protein